MLILKYLSNAHAWYTLTIDHGRVLCSLLVPYLVLLTDVLVLCGCTSMYQLLIGIQEDNPVPLSPYTPLDDDDTIVKVTVMCVRLYIGCNICT